MKRFVLGTSLVLGLLGAVGCTGDTATPLDIDQLTVELFGGIGAAAGPWERTRIDLSSEPAVYAYDRLEPGRVLCSVEASFTREQTDVILSQFAAIRYRQIETDLLSADQPTRTIQFRVDESTTTVYHLFDIDFDDDTFPELEFFYATAGADQLLETVSTLTQKCDPPETDLP